MVSNLYTAARLRRQEAHRPGTSDFCPLKNWREYSALLSDLPLSPETPLLLTVAPLAGDIDTIPALRAMLRRTTEAVGLSKFNYTLHSLRRGGAACSFQAGVPLQHIKFHGSGQLYFIPATLPYTSSKSFYIPPNQLILAA